MIYKEKFFWLLDNNLFPLTLTLNMKADITKCEQVVTANCSWNCCKSAINVSQIVCRLNRRTNVLHVAWLRNECRNELKLFAYRRKFRLLGAWLLRQVILFIEPDFEIRKTMRIKLVADGMYLNEQRNFCINQSKLVQYYENIGFLMQPEFSDTESSQMYGNAVKITKTIRKRLLQKTHTM